MRALLFFGVPAGLILAFGAWMLHMWRTDAAKRIDPAEAAAVEIADVEPSLERGRVLYVRHACASCHGETGRGDDDLTAVNRNFPSDGELIAWIRDPRAFRPDSPMPGFGDRIPARDFPHLIAYIRKLADDAR